MYECEKVGLDFLETAQFCFTAEEVITATPAQIFEVFEDARSWAVWATPIQKVEWTSPKPFGLGTTRTVYMSGGMDAYEEFIAWESGRRMAFCFVAMSHSSIESFAEDYQVTDLGDGRCKVRWVMAMQPRGFSRYVLRLIAPLMTWYNRKMFGKFREYIENQYATVNAAR